MGQIYSSADKDLLNARWINPEAGFYGPVVSKVITTTQQITTWEEWQVVADSFKPSAEKAGDCSLRRVRHVLEWSCIIIPVRHIRSRFYC